MSGWQIVVGVSLCVLFLVLCVVGYKAFIRSEIKDWEDSLSSVITSTKLVVFMEPDPEVLNALSQVLWTPCVRNHFVGMESPVILTRVLSSLLITNMVDHPLKKDVLAFTYGLWLEYQRHPDYHSYRIEGSRWLRMLMSALRERLIQTPSTGVRL